MQQVCKSCSKSFEADDAIIFCPYCGSLVNGHANVHNAEKNIVWKIETTFGNQSKYAEKSKEICSKLVSHALSWMAEQETPYWEKQNDSSITVQQVIDDFEFLRTPSGIAELEQDYRLFIKALIDICNGRINLRSKRQNSIDIYTHIQENLHTFAAMIGLPLCMNFHSCEHASNGSIVYRSADNFSRLFDALDKAFQSVKSIATTQGILCVQNCNFNPDDIRVLDKFVTVNYQGICCYDLQGVAESLINSSAHDYTDIFDNSYDRHLSMFFEAIWMLCTSIIDSYSTKVNTDDTISINESIDEWLSCMEISIDRVKNDPQVDMINIYQSCRKAFSTVKKNFN